MVTYVGIDVGRKNMGICEYDGGTRTITRWAVLDVKKGSAPDIHGVLTEYFGASPAVTVVIERQLPRAKCMCRIQHFVEMWHVVRGDRVYTQDAKRKLEFLHGAGWWTGSESAGTFDDSTYARRKKTAVTATREFVKTQPDEVVEVFKKSKKKDDLADSLLHVLAFVGSKTPSVKIEQKPAIVRARKPTVHQEQTKRYTPANLKYLLTRLPPDQTHSQHILAAATRHFGSLSACYRALGLESRTADSAPSSQP